MYILYFYILCSLFRFYDKRDAEDALDAMDGRILDGRELRVQMARYGRPSSPYRRYSRCVYTPTFLILVPIFNLSINVFNLLLFIITVARDLARAPVHAADPVLAHVPAPVLVVAAVVAVVAPTVALVLVLTARALEARARPRTRAAVVSAARPRASLAPDLNSLTRYYCS